MYACSSNMQFHRRNNAYLLCYSYHIYTPLLADLYAHAWEAEPHTHTTIRPHVDQLIVHCLEQLQELLGRGWWRLHPWPEAMLFKHSGGVSWISPCGQGWPLNPCGNGRVKQEQLGVAQKLHSQLTTYSLHLRTLAVTCGVEVGRDDGGRGGHAYSRARGIFCCGPLIYVCLLVLPPPIPSGRPPGQPLTYVLATSHRLRLFLLVIYLGKILGLYPFLKQLLPINWPVIGWLLIAKYCRWRCTIPT